MIVYTQQHDSHVQLRNTLLDVAGAVRNSLLDAFAARTGREPVHPISTTIAILADIITDRLTAGGLSPVTIHYSLVVPPERSKVTQRLHDLYEFQQQVTPAQASDLWKRMKACMPLFSEAEKALAAVPFRDKDLPEPEPGAHDFIKTGDPDAYDAIRDRNGHVVLQECRVCGQAEGDLTPTCPGRPKVSDA